MKRLPLGRIAVLMMIIFCNKQAIGAAVPFQQLNANLTNVDFTNQSMIPLGTIVRRHLLNITDTNSTHTNSTDACTSYSCIADKYYLNWVYGAVGAVTLIFGVKYIWNHRHRQNVQPIGYEIDPPPPPMDYYPDGIFEMANDQAIADTVVIHNPLRKNILLPNSEFVAPLPELEDVRESKLEALIHLPLQQNNLPDHLAHHLLSKPDANQLSKSQGILTPTTTIHQGVPQYHRTLKPLEASQLSKLERIMPPKKGPAVDVDPVTPPKVDRDSADAFLKKGNNLYSPNW